MHQHSTSQRNESQSTGLFWGVDVASAKLDLASHSRQEVLTVENSPTGIEQLLEHMRQQPVALIVVEATGGYETPLLTRLAEAGFRVGDECFGWFSQGRSLARPTLGFGI